MLSIDQPYPMVKESTLLGIMKFCCRLLPVALWKNWQLQVKDKARRDKAYLVSTVRTAFYEWGTIFRWLN